MIHTSNYSFKIINQHHHTNPKQYKQYKQYNIMLLSGENAWTEKAPVSVQFDSIDHTARDLL